jgi:hypothetical protein
MNFPHRSTMHDPAIHERTARALVIDLRETESSYFIA